MRFSIRAISATAIGTVLALGWGCSMIPPNAAPQDPFVTGEPAYAPQQRSRPNYAPPPQSRPAPRNSVDPYSGPPPRVSPPQKSQPAVPPRNPPKTFADPDRAPEPILVPPRDDAEPFRTEKPPSSESLPLEGPQLMPLDEASSSKTTGVAETTADRRLELRVEAPDRRPVGSGAPFQLSIRNVSSQMLRNVSVLCEFDEPLRFPGSDRKNVTHKIPRIDPGDVKDSLLTLISETAGPHECRFSVRVGSQVVLRKTVTVEFVSRQLDWQVHGPTERTVGSRAEFNIPLINVSGKELRDLKIRVNFDAALTVREMTQGGRLGDRSLTWEIDRIAANEGLLLQLEVECREPTTQACLQVTVNGLDLPDDEREACLTVKQRTGWLEVRVHDVTDPISVGDEAELVVTIQNEGLQSAKDVVAGCTWPEGLEFVSATVQLGDRSQPVLAEVQDRTATFAPTASLAPNESVEYHVLLKGRTAGTHRLTVSVINSSDGTPVKVMEPIMVHR